MKSTWGHQLLACGRYGLPKTLPLGPRRYILEQVFKHDFFAGTARYRHVPGEPGTDAASQPGRRVHLDAPAGALPEQVVLKVNRHADLLGVPLAWLGAYLARHEWEILQRLQSLPGGRTPTPLGRYGSTGLIYGYIEGHSLDEKPALPAGFFDDLAELLAGLHARRIAYVDMNKRGNILVRPDGRAALIDFQISWHAPRRLAGSRWWADAVLARLAAEDRYHLYKHKRRFQPEQMSPDDLAQSRRVSGWVTWHRRLTRPLTTLRRRVLGWLYRRGDLITDDSVGRSPENDPSRWLK